MGRSHSKSEKSPAHSSSALSPHQKLKKNENKKNRKSNFPNKKSKLDSLKTPRRSLISDGLEKDEELEMKLHMQEQLAFNSDIWVLNQMMMSVQFFANYERDLFEAVELNREREAQKSKNLAKHCKNVLLPDRLHEAVDRRVKYVAKHGKHKNQLLPLHTQTLYIVHDNIEIMNPGESSVYSVLTEAPLYKLQIDDPYEGTRKKKILHHSGFVKLKSSEKISKTDVISQNLSSDSQYISESNKNDYDDENLSETEIPEAFLRNKFRDSVRYGKSLRNSSTSIYDRNYYTSSISTNSTSPSSSEYDYTYIRALHTHQPLSMLRRSALISQLISTVKLPDTCITNVSRFMVNSHKQENFYSTGYASDEEDADEQQDNDEQSDYDGKSNSYYEDKQYLNSKEFLSYFINLFQQTLAEDLGISKETLSQATWKGSSVYCAPWEIIPALSCAWPREANEWIYRQREMREDPMTKQKIQWPSLEMINKITNFGCHVIPLGYAPKNGSNPQRDLEWKIVFPEAERYLESRLTSAQTKIYMITKALFKKFVNQNVEDGINMFTAEHLRSHLFWQCEHNYIAWPEDRLGETLLKFLCSLLHCIKIHRLPDYFMPRRNLFENIPEKLLVDLHKRIYRIVESPVPFVLIVLRNLRYQRDFYPKLKYKKLYSRLLAENPSRINNLNADVDINAPSDDETKEASLGSIAYYEKIERKSKRRKKRCVRFALDEHYVAAYSRKKETEKEIRRVSTDSIDIKVKVTFMKHMEVLRRKLVFELFIEQFIAMARVSMKYRSLQQTMTQLKQAQRICSLLNDDKHEQDAENYEENIEQISKSVQDLLKESSIDGPELPRRFSLVDHESTKNRNRPAVSPKINEEESSDDDNDEIYNYHQSVIAQLHATSAENLARFQHTDENDDEEEFDSLSKSLDKMELNLNQSQNDEQNEPVTKL